MTDLQILSKRDLIELLNKKLVLVSDREVANLKLQALEARCNRLKMEWMVSLEKERAAFAIWRLDKRSKKRTQKWIYWREQTRKAHSEWDQACKALNDYCEKVTQGAMAA